MNFQLSPYDVMLLKGMKVSDAPAEQMVPLGRYEAALARQAEMYAAAMAEKDEAAVVLVRAVQRLAVERDGARTELANVRCRLTRLTRVVWAVAVCVPLASAMVKAVGWLWAQ